MTKELIIAIVAIARRETLRRRRFCLGFGGRLRDHARSGRSRTHDHHDADAKHPRRGAREREHKLISYHVSPGEVQRIETEKEQERIVKKGDTKKTDRACGDRRALPYRNGPICTLPDLLLLQSRREFVRLRAVFEIQDENVVRILPVHVLLDLGRNYRLCETPWI